MIPEILFYSRRNNLVRFFFLLRAYERGGKSNALFTSGREGFCLILTFNPPNLLSSKALAFLTHLAQ